MCVNKSILLMSVGFGFAPPLLALDVVMAGAFGSKAVLVVDGGAPQTVGVNQSTREGVRLPALVGQTATLEHEGRAFQVRVGEHAASAPPQFDIAIADAGGVAQLSR